MRKPFFAFTIITLLMISGLVIALLDEQRQKNEALPTLQPEMQNSLVSANGSLIISVSSIHMNIRRIWTLEKAGDHEPFRDTFLNLDIELDNQSKHSVCLYDRNFRMQVGEEAIFPGDMTAVRNTFDAQRDYPDSILGQCIRSQQKQNSLLVYDIPEGVTDFTLYFDPDGGQSAGVVFWLSPEQAGNYSFGIKAAAESTVTVGEASSLPQDTPPFTQTIEAPDLATPTKPDAATIAPSTVPSSTSTLTETFEPTDTSTATPTKTTIPTQTPSQTETATAILTKNATSTVTPPPSATHTRTATLVLTVTPSPSATHTRTATPSPSMTYTLTRTPTPTVTTSSTATHTATAANPPSATPVTFVYVVGAPNSSVNVRAEPSTTALVSATVSGGTPLILQDKQTNNVGELWYYVEYAPNQMGWVRSDLVSFSP